MHCQLFHNESPSRTFNQTTHNMYFVFMFTQFWLVFIHSQKTATYISYFEDIPVDNME